MSYYGDLIESETISSFRERAGKIEDRLRTNEDARSHAQSLIAQMKDLQTKVSDWAKEVVEGVIKSLEQEVKQYNERHENK